MKSVDKLHTVANKLHTIADKPDRVADKLPRIADELHKIADKLDRVADEPDRVAAGLRKIAGRLGNPRDLLWLPGGWFPQIAASFHLFFGGLSIFGNWLPPLTDLLLECVNWLFVPM